MAEQNKISSINDQDDMSNKNMILKNSHSEKDIVISGISGTFANSRNVHEFGENLYNKVQMVSSRGRWDNFNHPDMPKYVGLIPNIEKYDAGFFGDHERQSQTSDPIMRILQEKVTEAIIDAGLHPSDLEGTKTGVYIGTASSESNLMLMKYEQSNFETSISTGWFRSVQAHRLSYFFKLRGPSFITDTACSSSLYALEHAFRALSLGEVDNAIVCGTHLILNPYGTLQFVRLGALSNDGSCKVFDKLANGYVRSEAIGCLLLQKAKNAKRIYAQVIDAKTNCDGFKDNGITFPSTEAQAELMKTFYEDCNINSNSLSYLEAHGTGTVVGDPQECSAIDAVLTRNRNAPLLIGSVKSNVGHSEPAAGISSIIKCIISMESGFIPPNINYNSLREELKGIVEGRMKVVTEKMRFEDNRGLVGINGFGFGGANCHVLLRWNPKEKRNGGLPDDTLPRLVIVSGRTDAAITSLLDEFNRNELDVDYIKLLHNIFRKNIENHIYRGFIIVSKSGEITRSVKYYNGKHRPIYFIFGELNNWLEVGNNLMDLPVFADSIERTQKVLSDSGINISNILRNKTLEGDYQILGSVAVQIGIIDTLKLLELRPKYCLGFSFGVLPSAYFKGNLTLEETINCAHVINDISIDALKLYKSRSNNQVNYTRDNNCTMIVNNNGRRLNDLREALKSEKSIHKSLEDGFTDKSYKDGTNFNSKHRTVDKVLKDNIFDESNCIELCSVVYKIGNSPIEDAKDVIAVNENSKGRNYLVELLENFGRLYEYGCNPQLEKLYPAVELPVSRGTQIISPHIKWKHNRNWFVPQYKKLDHRCKQFKIFCGDRRWEFLEGHTIDGRNLFPATGYLYLVWRSLASINSLRLCSTSVVFEKCKFIKAITIPNNSDIKLYITIQKSTGNFEIVEGDTVVVTGTISLVEDAPSQTTIPCRLIAESNDVGTSLKSKDIYKELRLRGYNYKGEFCAIQEYDSRVSKAYIKWNNNWTAFMDNMLQMKILEYDTRLLYVPTSIERLTISPQNHLDWVNHNGTDEEKNPVLPVFNDQTRGVISCGGIQIWGLIASAISRKKYLGTPVMESYKFVPNIASLTPIESVRVNMQIILENTQTYKVKVVELIDNYSEKHATYLSPIVLSVLEDQPLIQPLVKILSKTPLDVNVEVEDAKLTREKDCLLVIGTNILGRPAVLKNACDAVTKKGFILSREPRDFDTASLTDMEATVITVHKTSTETLIMLRMYFEVQKSVGFKITSANNFSWVPQLKDIILESVENDIVIYSDNESQSGILGFVNCLRREPYGQNIRCAFVMDTDEEFHPNVHHCAIQLKKNMAINVYKNGQWGTYRHMLVDKLEHVQSGHCYANITVIGDLSSFKWVEGPLRHNIAFTPENRLAYVYYAALNFRDIMTALGKISVDVISKDRREQECVQGLEFSGKDEKGNRVMGVVNSGALSTMVLVDTNLIYKVPDAWTLAEAATVPIVYLTVIYALHIRGTLKHGESILIHSGTGGIGQAAISLALLHGCTVFTTVGTQAKREFLKKTFPQLDDRHIGNSRDESFEQMIFKGTKGRGVDMVLNSLAEDKLLASVRCLARGGRFIEIGKFDIANNNQLDLLLFKKDASFQGVMLDMMFNESPHKKAILYRLMNEGIQSGTIKPLNQTIFKVDEVEQAFRFMASGKHMGKVLVQIRSPEEDIVSQPSMQKFNCLPRYWCDPDMVYIIVGGLGGFGLELADWLVLRGARKLVLTTRSGVSTGYQNYRIGIWQSYGTVVKISKYDITTKTGCQDLIDESHELGTIHAIFNLAVILDDSIFENQTPDRFRIAFGPKALATQYLDELSRNRCPSLRDFVIFSSVSCGRGNAGQTNYGMANSVMERICENRRRDGFPALAIQWGAVGDVGLVAEMQVQHTDRVIGGTLQQPISSCLKVLDSFLKQKSEVILSSMVVAEKQGGIGAANNMVEAVANILGINDIKLISVQSTLAELGMDSLTAVEISQVLKDNFDITLSAKEMRTMTFTRLREIQAENDVDDSIDVNSKVTEFGLSTILRLIGTEPESKLLHIRLKSKVDEKQLAPKLLLFPGVEGFAKVYEPLAVHLNAHTVCVQYTYPDMNETIESMAKSLLPFVEEYITKNEPFMFLAYSYGVLIAIEVVSILESKGYTGTLICLDGSPLLLKEIMNILNLQSKENLQIAFIYQILSIILEKQDISCYKETFLNCKSWEGRLTLLTKITKDYSTLEESYQRTLANGLYQRIEIIKSYSPSYGKLKSKVKLFKAKSATIQGLPEDHRLSELFDTSVEVQIFEGDHSSILNNELLANAINALI